MTQSPVDAARLAKSEGLAVQVPVLKKSFATESAAPEPDDSARQAATTLSAEIDAAKGELGIWQSVDDAIGSASGDRFTDRDMGDEIRATRSLSGWRTVSGLFGACAGAVGARRPGVLCRIQSAWPLKIRPCVAKPPSPAGERRLVTA